MGQSQLEIKVLAKNLAKEALQSAREELKATGEAAKKAGEDAAGGSKTAKLSLTDLKSGLDMAIGGFKAFADAAKAAFEFSQQGAQVKQLRDNFSTTGIALESLRRSSRGTVDDMTLMSGTMTLLAGSSGQVRAAYQDAVPQLLEMAKAASKLNPALGDTSFMFQSISTAAKRQSMQIADNLGIIVKQGAAYEKYAASLGISAEALTDEQKQVAFLNGLLDAGNVLLEQAGGSVDSYTDAWEQATAQLKNATDEMKVNAARGLAPLVQSVANSLGTINERNAELAKGAALFGDRYVVAWQNAQRGVRAAREELAGMNVEMERARLQAQEADIIAQGFNDVGVGALRAKPAVQALTETIITNFGSAEQMGEAAKKAYSDFQMIIKGPLREEMEDFTAKQYEAMTEVDQLSHKISLLESKRYLTAAQKKELGELSADLYLAQQAVEDNAAAHAEATKRIVFGFMEQRLAMDGLTQAELMALQEVAKNWGLIDDATYTAITGIDNVASAFEAGQIKAENFGSILSGVGDVIAGLPTSWTFDVTYNIPNLPAMPGSGGTPSKQGEGYVANAEGGTMNSSGWSLVGEQGPELTWLPRGAQVYNARETQQMLQQSGQEGGVVVNAPVTINATVASNVDIALLARQVGDEIGKRVAARRAF